jgi:uncharacterized protein YceH (UPF0502 family)
MPPQLQEEEARVLGSLIEKDMATPEYYPMSMNALVNACNQKSNRDPVVHYDEDVVDRALESLRDKRLTMVTRGGDNRVPKYSHRASETLDVNNRELAVLAVLLLRGPQTVGELKTRTERLHAFDDLDGVETTLRGLAEKGLAVLLPRQVGMREPRWGHLLCGEPRILESAAPGIEQGGGHEPLSERLARLEAEVEGLRAQFAEFKRQFE